MQSVRLMLAILQSRHAGGAAAQCRFAGGCAIPIGTTAPVDGSPVTSRKHQIRQPGTLAASIHPAGGSVQPDSSEFTSRWRFDLKLWQWVLKNPSDDCELLHTAKSQLAARRWGDGRDQLSAAAAEFSTTASSRKRPAGVQSSAAAEASSNADDKVRFVHAEVAFANMNVCMRWYLVIASADSSSCYNYYTLAGCFQDA